MVQCSHILGAQMKEFIVVRAIPKVDKLDSAKTV